MQDITDEEYQQFLGLRSRARRDEFAKAALIAIGASWPNDESCTTGDLATFAVELADRLIEQLDRPAQGKE